MLQRITGTGILFAGVALVLLGAGEWCSTGATANLLSADSRLNGEVFDTSAWTTSSYLLSTALMVVGATVIAAGVYVARNKHTGYLFLAAAALFLAVFPSAFAQARFIRQHMFVSSGIQEVAAYTTTICILISFAACIPLVIIKRKGFWRSTGCSSPTPADNVSGSLLHSRGVLYRLYVRDLANFLFWIATGGLATFCLTFGTPVVGRISATKVVVWAGCKPHGFEALGSCPAGSLAERFMPLTFWLDSIYAPITLIVAFDDILLVWICICFLLGFARTAFKVNSQT